MKDICKVEATALHYKRKRSTYGTLPTGQLFNSYSILYIHTHKYICTHIAYVFECQCNDNSISDMR